MAEGDFLTVTEAARRLGVDPRQVRRWMDRLEPKDKGQDTQRTHKGHPIVLVRVSAVEALKNGTFPQHEPKDTFKGQDIGQSKDSVRVSVENQRTGHPKDKAAKDVSDEVSLALREIITRQDAEIARLAEALATSQRLTDQAQQLQLMTERRAAALEAEVEKLKAIEAMPTDSTPMPAEAAQGRRSCAPVEGAEGDMGQDGEVGPALKSEEQKRPWWAFWRDR